VLKCLEKDPARRYATAADLIADVRRHLRHETVSARPAGVLVHARKFVRRNRQPLVAASFVLAATVFAGLWDAARQQNEVRDAEGLRQEARRLSYRYPEIAQERLRRAEDLAPSLPGLGADRAYVLVRLRRRAEAEQAVQRVLAADPNNGPALA